MSAPQKNRPRLGRGLSSLISTEAATSQQTDAPLPSLPASAPAAALRPVDGQPMEIPLSAISRNPHQPRRSFNDTAIAELADSIRSTGLIQPVIVRREGEGYELIAGERRWRAAQLAGLSAIPAIVRQVDAYTQAQMALVENIQREDLNPVDRAQAYRSLMDQLGLTQAELAGRLGEDRSSIANHLRLLDLPDTVRELIRDGQLSLGHAKLLAGLDDPAEQRRLAELAASQDLSVRNLERLVQQGGKPPATPTPRPASAHIADLENSLTRQLGMRVQVRTGHKGKGKLVIHYSSLDQFDDVVERLGLKLEAT